MTPTLDVRHARQSDAPALLELMRGLALFEGYHDDFAVTVDTLVRHGFSGEPADFRALVVDAPDGGLAGMLVYYFIPFAFRARPTLYIKEVFVHPAHRSGGVGHSLMRAAARIARDADCAVVKWQVARWNDGGRRFYERLGATPDEQWVDYQLTRDSIVQLAE